MSIEMMKKLEDLKAIASTYYKEIAVKNDQKKEQYIKDAINDFENFFREKGFSVTKKSNETIASYSELVAKLSYDDPSTNYFGTEFKFDLDLTALRKEKIIVLLNNKKPGLTISTSITSGEDSDKLQNEIASLEKDIEKAKVTLQNIDSEVWSFYIKDENANYGYQVGEPTISMYNLLEELIK